MAWAVPRIAQAPVRAGLIASAVVVAVAFPAWGGFGRKANNPSVLPLDYTTATLTVIGVVWVLVAVWLATRIVRRAHETSGRA